MSRFSANNLKRLGVFTSGGDAPGMNSAIRAIVRNAAHHRIEVVGVRHGYTGLLEERFEPLNVGSVANILQRGGTILKAGRCQEFLKPEPRKRAAQNLRNHNIDALICIGGDGSLRGAEALWQEHGVPSVGLPGTIDNDINGTDMSIGFDTAVNTALEAIDKIRDTAASHDRLFIVEVMGRNSGFLATHVGVAGGAEAVFTPEGFTTVDHAIHQIRQGMARGKGSSILVAAEGQKPGRAYDLSEAIRKKAGLDAKVCVLGHVQRGGSPTAADRVLSSRLGAAAVNLLRQGTCHVMTGWQSGQLVQVDLSTALKTKPFQDKDLLELTKILSQ